MKIHIAGRRLLSLADSLCHGNLRLEHRSPKKITSSILGTRPRRDFQGKSKRPQALRPLSRLPARDFPDAVRDTWRPVPRLPRNQPNAASWSPSIRLSPPTIVQPHSSFTRSLYLFLHSLTPNEPAGLTVTLPSITPASAGRSEATRNQ